MVTDLTPVMPFFVGFFLLAAFTALLSAGVLVGAVVTHRRTRLASRESVRRYYGRFALAH